MSEPTDRPQFLVRKSDRERIKEESQRHPMNPNSEIHGWSLDGPHGFAKDISPIPFTGTKTITLKLKAGSYKFYCPAHEPTMFGHFKAT